MMSFREAAKMRRIASRCHAPLLRGMPQRPGSFPQLAHRAAALRFQASSRDRAQSTVAAQPQSSGSEDALRNLAVSPGAARSNYEEWMVNLRGEDAWLAFDRNDATWFTGKQPLPGVCPGVSPVDGRIKALPMMNLDKVTRKAAQDYFDNSWTRFETLFAGFKGEEPFYRPPVHGLRHPQIFYYGHTPCLYINKLRVAGVLKEPVNAYMESIFEVGVDEMLWDDMHKNDMVWPTVKEVHEYRKEVYRVVSEVIATHPSLDDKDGTAPVKVTWDHPMWSLFMGFEHEAIHLETSSVLFRETPSQLMQVPKAWPKLHPSSQRPVQRKTAPVEGEDFPKNEMLRVAGETVTLGKPRDFPSYGWDNEYGHREVQVPDFSASKHMITNGEFWHFVADGGYRTEKYWSADGWGWRKYRNMKWPFFWVQDGPQGSMQFKLRTVFEEINMQWDWPVDVNYHEAKAFCAWKAEKDGLVGKPEAYRVITEAEHNLIRPPQARVENMRSASDDRALCVGGEEYAIPGPGAANLNLAYASQSPVDALPPSPTGHHDAMGNAWEWTEDHFNPLPGFKVSYIYDDFSAPCFDGRHHIIMGGSFASCGDNGASGFCRYHFRAHFLQHSGFRLVSSTSPAPATHLQVEETQAPSTTTETSKPAAGTGAAVAGSMGYETQSLVDQYLGLHFPASGTASVEPLLSHPGAPEHALRFPQRVAQLLLEARIGAGGKSGALRALDVGCAVGGSSFELAAGGFDEVLGIDFSNAFVETAQRMQRGEALSFKVPIEGELQVEIQAQHEPNVDAAVRERVSFRTGDACKLKEEAATLGSFDGAILANLLCRLPDPMACLDGLEAVIAPGGAVVIVTPFSWLEDFTPKSKWLGGFQDPVSGEAIRSKDQLKVEMEKRGFTKLKEEQMPLLIREHQRKYQYIVSEATVWRRQ
eukprot:TRINITY_DN39988_c0_g1_i1.p1 TRINITY_DN39988_c0_g1~~TRINITY_DN39988_c0_g1_i1.p1  ORF type:complete len:926 (-),score=230.29 TRINITY_DN39988_c0_g1_i1:23-2800(-)